MFVSVIFGFAAKTFTMASRNVPLRHLPIRPSTLELFQKRGFTTSKDVEQAKATGMASLAAELHLSLTETARLYREVQSCLQRKENDSKTASTTLIDMSAATSIRNIITFCKEADVLLGGGIALGELTEVAGTPGAAKTQLAMQLAVDASIPTQFGGVQGEAIYIDSEGSFSPERCHTLAKALVTHMHQGVQRRKPANRQLPDWFTPDNVLEGIHVYRVHDEAAQTAVFHSLPSFIQQRATLAQRPIKLVIIDSIAFHYRAAPPDSDFVQRTQSLTRQAAFLADLANRFDLAVVAINQMTTKVLGGTMQPALGESWAHAVTTRILLRREGDQRVCELTKSPRLASGTANFQVMERGIRGVDSNKRQKSS